VTVPAETPEATVDIESPGRLVDFVLRARTLGILVVLALLVLVTALIQSRFVDGADIKFIFQQTSLYALLAVGEAMVILTRNVDLSVGSVCGFSAYISAHMFATHPGIAIPLVFLVGLGVGLVCGILTGTIVAAGRVPSLVVTLAMLYIIRGVDTIVVGPGVVLASTEPAAFLRIPEASVLGLPDIALAVAALVAVAAYYLNSFRSGRDLYAIGSDPQAARLAGIPIANRVFTAFVISGACAGVAGVVWACEYATIESTAATGIELQVIAAVVVGGVAIFGGSGSVVGAALGALLLQTINSALNVTGVLPSTWTEAISGFLLLAAITLDRGIQLRLSTALRRRRVRLGA
jgi:rhamnose transport system permease protein